MEMCQYQVISGLFLSLVASVHPSRPPNVLFIVADDLGWNDVSWHNPNIYSPTLEKLASGGILLDQYYVQPTCSPSRVAFMTGQYPYRVGRQHMYIKPLMPTGLAANVKIMPEYFKDAGYNTHAIGKWHLGFCHQNYTPTYRGFDSFYGFYIGSEDYYTHSKTVDLKHLGSTHTHGYDFRFNEKILKGPEVDRKYSADLFVNRAKTVFEEHRRLEDAGVGKPWFTYLSFQSVHDPLQVPHIYKENVCRYKDNSRYFYSAMVNSLDHSMDLVVQSLKANKFYDNTIIVFTTDNGGAVQMGGNNWPLRGTKGTLFEGGTRGIGFIHSPLLAKSGYTSHNLMHAVDWLPTLLSAVGKDDMETSAKDGVDQWKSLSDTSKEKPRREIVYNVKEKPFMAALRIGDYKMIWGSRTTKDTWYKPKEEPLNKFVCNEIKRSRNKANRSRILLPRGVETMDVLKLDIDEDVEYEDDYENIEKVQLNEDPSILDKTMSVFSLIGDRFGKGNKYDRESRENYFDKGNNEKNESGGNKKKKKKKGGKNKNKKNGGKNNKNMILPNKFGVHIKTFGEIQMFNLKEDPEERKNIANDEPEIRDQIKARVIEHFYNLYPRNVPNDTLAGDPRKWGGYYGPGWCDTMNILPSATQS